MKRLRTVIFWAHLTIGVSIAAVVLVMAATGALLTYQRQVQAWADTRGMDGSPPNASAALLPPDAIAERAHAVRGGMTTGMRWRRDPHAPVEVLFGRESTLFVNGYTGAVLGDGSERTRAFFRGVTAAHRWLALSGSGQARGRAITGAANMAFLFLVLAGFYLWWPRNLTARAFRSVLLFRGGLRGKARDFNWHNVIGIWSLTPLLIIIASAAVISYAWAGALVERLATGQHPHTEVRTAPVVPESAPPDRAGAALPLPALRRAAAQLSDWQSLTMQLPVRGDAVAIVLDGGTGGQPHRQAELTFSPATGEVLRWEPFSSGSRPQRVRSILRYAHTGEVLGVAGQTIAGAASAAAVAMVWTGIALALRRLRAWLGRRRRDAAGRRADRTAVDTGSRPAP
jgi:uncharacterized iron-regulated membrane protein